jgi:predicted nucleic acid-binding protein
LFITTGALPASAYELERNNAKLEYRLYLHILNHKGTDTQHQSLQIHDAAICEAAKRHDCILITNDKNLHHWTNEFEAGKSMLYPDFILCIHDDMIS